MPSPAESRCSTAALAGVLGVSSRRVNQLVAEGILTRGQDSKFGLGPSVRAFIEHKLTAVAAPGDAAELTRQRALLAQAQRLKLEREASIAAGELCSKADLIATLTHFAVIIRQKLLGLPSKMAPMLVGEELPAISKALTDEIYETLTELSNMPDGSQA